MEYINWITDNIAVGPAPDTNALNKIKEEGVNCIVDARSEYKNDENFIKSLGMFFFHIPVDDRYGPSTEQLNGLFDFINPLLDKGKKVFIHCQNGYGRSPLIAMALLIKRGLSTQDAVGLVEEKYPFVSFTPMQEQFIYSLEHELP